MLRPRETLAQLLVVGVRDAVDARRVTNHHVGGILTAATPT